MVNSKHVHFYWGVVYSLDPSNAYLGEGLDPPDPPPPGINAPARNVRFLLLHTGYS